MPRTFAQIISPRTARRIAAPAIASLVAMLDGCTDRGPTQVTDARAGPSAIAASIADDATLRLCNAGPTSSYLVSASVGVVLPSLSLDDGQCAVVWRFTAGSNVLVSIARVTAVSAQTDAIVSLVGDGRHVRYAISTISIVAGRPRPAIVFFNSPAGDDPWHVTKGLIKSCEQYNAWLAKVQAMLNAYLATLTGTDAVTQATRAVVQRAIDELPPCTKESDLDDIKNVADLLLRPIDIIKASAALWKSGFELYAAAIDLIIKSLTDPVGVPFGLINKTLDFLITGAKAVGNTEGAKKLEQVKELKDRVERGLDTLENLKKALEAVRPLVLKNP